MKWSVSRFHSIYHDGDTKWNKQSRHFEFCSKEQSHDEGHYAKVVLAKNMQKYTNMFVDCNAGISAFSSTAFGPKFSSITIACDAFNITPNGVWYSCLRRFGLFLPFYTIRDVSVGAPFFFHIMNIDTTKRCESNKLLLWINLPDTVPRKFIFIFFVSV